MYQHKLEDLVAFAEDILYERVDIPTECIGGCEYLVSLPDIFATGDSPTDYNCTANPDECPVVRNQILKLGD